MNDMLRSVELFSGAGGLAYGMALAGFKHKADHQLDTDSCDTLRLNKRRRGLKHVRDWKIIEANLTAFDYSEIEGPVDVLAGGVPCQPFSLGGKHRPHQDSEICFLTSPEQCLNSDRVTHSREREGPTPFILQRLLRVRHSSSLASRSSET